MWVIGFDLLPRIHDGKGTWSSQMGLPERITPAISTLKKRVCDSKRYTASDVLNSCPIAMQLKSH